MKKSAWLSLPAMLGLFVSLAVPQSTHHFPTPPESLDAQPPKVDSPTAPLRVDIEQLQREADTLARTAQTIPSDVASIRKGMLPKDAIEKLKQIEKLSKHLRTELTP